MLDYKNVKIADEVIIVEKQENYRCWCYSWSHERGEKIRGEYYHQGYVVDAGNKKMLETALSWADTRAYNEEKDEWEDTYLPGIEHRYKNGQFEITLCDSADGSSQGGKLAFWNCIITCPDGKEFLVGINADILLELLLENTFVNGKCQNKVYLGRIAGKQVGAFTENMELFAQAQKDEAKRQANANGDSKYKPGDIVKTLTETQVYLGEVYCAGEEIPGEYWAEHKINIYNNPPVRHVFIDLEDNNELSKYIYDEGIKKTKPKRIVDGHIDLADTAYNYIVKLADQKIAECQKEKWQGDWIKDYNFRKLRLANTAEEAKQKQDEVIKSFTERYHGAYNSHVKIERID